MKRVTILVAGTLLSISLNAFSSESVEDAGKLSGTEALREAVQNLLNDDDYERESRINLYGLRAYAPRCILRFDQKTGGYTWTGSFSSSPTISS